MSIIIFHTGPTVTYPDKCQNQKNKCATEQSNTGERGVLGSVMGGVMVEEENQSQGRRSDESELDT